MYFDDLTIYDIESAVLTGKIIERQRDNVTSEWKYRIEGKTVGNDQVEVITKLGPTDKLIIITVYAL